MPTLDSENALTFLKSLDFSSEEVVEELSPLCELSPLNLGEEEVLLVERPGMSRHSSSSLVHLTLT